MKTITVHVSEESGMNAPLSIHLMPGGPNPAVKAASGGEDARSTEQAGRPLLNEFRAPRGFLADQDR